MTYKKAGSIDLLRSRSRRNRARLGQDPQNGDENAFCYTVYDAFTRFACFAVVPW